MSRSSSAICSTKTSARTALATPSSRARASPSHQSPRTLHRVTSRLPASPPMSLSRAMASSWSRKTACRPTLAPAISKWHRQPARNRRRSTRPRIPRRQWRRQHQRGLTTLALGAGTVSPATVTANVSLTSNLDATAAVGSTYSTQATIYDSLGGSHNITFTYTKSATNTWTYAATIPAADITGAVAPVSVATGTLIFNGDGTLKSITPTGGAASLTNPSITVPPVPPVTIPVTPQSVFADGANQLSFTWHVANAGVGLLTQLAGPNSTASIQQDGTSSGTLQNFNIGSDGTITGSFSNGKTATIGQIALASFADEQGLSHQGSNDFTPTLASGQPTIGGPGTGGLGSISGGALEQSNVDIASEFAALIVAQRSYEANARVVTTFDQVAQATIALKP